MMNKVTRDLAVQANLQPYYDAQEGHIDAFAGLIVQECLKICQQLGSPVSITHATPAQIEEAIRNHFGIK